VRGGEGVLGAAAVLAGWTLVGPAAGLGLGLGFRMFFSFLIKNVNKYKQFKNHNNYTKIIYN
jgi:hypothetical protein